MSYCKVDNDTELVNSCFFLVMVNASNFSLYTAKSRRIRFADDDALSDDERKEAEERRARRQQRKLEKRGKKERREKRKADSGAKKKVSALQAMMLKMAGQDTQDFEKEGESSSSSYSESSSSSSTESDDDDYNRRLAGSDGRVTFLPFISFY